jgi:hypothetical protein
MTLRRWRSSALTRAADHPIDTCCFDTARRASNYRAGAGTCCDVLPAPERGRIRVIVPRDSTHIVFSLALAASLLGCAEHLAFTEADPWFKPLEQWSAAHDALSVRWVEVKSSASAQAERRLLSTDAERVSRDDASIYAAKPLKIGDHEEPCLVRGLYLNRGTGGFTVKFDGRDLYVLHGSLGRHAVPMTRQPLLVALPRLPAHVYVSVWMAE